MPQTRLSSATVNSFSMINLSSVRQIQNYFIDIKEMRKAPIEGAALEFSKANAVDAKPTLARAFFRTAITLARWVSSSYTGAGL